MLTNRENERDAIHNISSFVSKYIFYAASISPNNVIDSVASADRRCSILDDLAEENCEVSKTPMTRYHDTTRAYECDIDVWTRN